MSSHSKIHQVNLDNWSVRIAEQAASGLTIRQWCSQNNVSFHKYNYWKHLLKEQVTDSVLPDIVPVTLPSDKPYELHESYNSYNSHDALPSNTISLSMNGITIQIPSQLIPMLPDIIKAVRYA